MHPGLKFKRHTDIIRPICQSAMKEGDTVLYEVPVKSTAKSFKLDIFRYTMQCVYSGECLFPCAFNQEAPADDIKVFFDYVFRTTYKRGVSEKLALALYAHNKNNPPFLFKTIGVFEKSEGANCIRASYENGETFLTATRNIPVGEVLTVSPNSFVVPTQNEESDFSNTLRLMADIDLDDAPVFAKALSYREKAMLVRPDARVVHVNSKLDPDLDKRVAKYTMDRELGITDFHVGLDRLGKKYEEREDNKDLLDLEELYDKLNGDFEADKMCS